MLFYNAAMAADQGSLRGDLKDSMETAWRLYCALRMSLPFKERHNGERIHRQKLSASTAPWHEAAAGLTHDFHTKVRSLEVNLRIDVTGLTGVRRGSSEENTQRALHALSDLAVRASDQQVRDVSGYFARWNQRAEAVINPDRGLRRVPREPGQPELRCPWCTYQTMRWQPATGVLVCVNPECRTDADVRPRWMAAYELGDDGWNFTWEPMGEGAA
jgi:hypothetical protein